MRDLERDGMSVELTRAVRLLRREPEPDPALREAVINEISSLPVPRRPRARVWSVRPWTALAAGFCCAVLGASAFALYARRPAGVALDVRAALPTSTVRFTIDAPNAARVALAGDFNAWSPTSLPLTRAPDRRTWVIEIPLSPGRYAYTFVVDGVLASDPAAPRATDDDFGAPSSVVLVRGT